MLHAVHNAHNTTSKIKINQEECEDRAKRPHQLVEDQLSIDIDMYIHTNTTMRVNTINLTNHHN